MAKFKKIFFILLIVVLSGGCARLSLHKEDRGKIAEKIVESETEVKGEKKGEEAPEEQLAKAFNILDQRIKGLVLAAKKEGSRAVDFLASDLFLKGNDASMRGDSQTAAYLFKHLISLKPEDDFLNKKYAIELIRMGRLGEAKDILLALNLKKGGEYGDETLALILGGVLSALGEKEKARETYWEIIKRYPKSEEACIFLSKSYALNSLYAKAHKVLDKCYRVERKASFAYYDGKVFLKEGRTKRAIQKFKTALRIEPRYYQAAIAIGLTWEEEENFRGAAQTYKNFLKKSPESYPILSRLVQLLFTQEKFQEVLPYAERLSSIDSSDLNLKVRLGILYTDNKSYDKAIAVFKEILDAAPTLDKVLYYLGTLYQEVEKLDMAIKYFGQIPETSALFPDSSLQMARIFQILVQMDDGKWSEQYLHFLRERGGHLGNLKVEFQVMMATYFEEKMEYEKAIESIEEVRQVESYDEDHDYYLASLYEKVQDFSRSRSIIREILKKNPDNADALNFLGYSLLVEEGSENMDEAFRLISKAVKLKPNDGYIRDSLGWFYYKTGKVEKALAEIKKAFELVKTDVVITKHLAIIYKELEKFEMAEKYFSEALKNCRLDSERKDIIEALGSLQKMRLPASSSLD